MQTSLACTQGTVRLAPPACRLLWQQRAGRPGIELDATSSDIDAGMRASLKAARRVRLRLRKRKSELRRPRGRWPNCSLEREYVHVLFFTHSTVGADYMFNAILGGQSHRYSLIHNGGNLSTRNEPFAFWLDSSLLLAYCAIGRCARALAGPLQPPG